MLTTTWGLEELSQAPSHPSCPVTTSLPLPLTCIQHICRSWKSHHNLAGMQTWGGALLLGTGQRLWLFPGPEGLLPQAFARPSEGPVPSGSSGHGGAESQAEEERQTSIVSASPSLQITISSQDSHRSCAFNCTAHPSFCHGGRDGSSFTREGWFSFMSAGLPGEAWSRAEYLVLLWGSRGREARALGHSRGVAHAQVLGKTPLCQRGRRPFPRECLLQEGVSSQGWMPVRGTEEIYFTWLQP